MKSSILKRAKKIKLLAMDVDGVLTGGEIIILNSGEEVKFWSVKDRMGFALLKKSGLPIRLAWLTARESKQVALRAKDIGINFLYQKCTDKWKALNSLAQKLKIKPEEIAYIGDDYVDLTSLKNVGLSVCPPEAPELLQKICHYQTKTPAGKGALREVIEIILKAQGVFHKALKQFLCLTLLVLIASLGCSPKLPPQKTEQPDQWIESFTITETSNGVPVWVLNSKSAEVYNKKKKAILTEISLQFLNLPKAIKNGSQRNLAAAKKALTQTARLTAPAGEVATDEHDLKAWGGVTVQSEEGATLYTERLNFNTKSQKIVTESPVKIVKQDSILLGEGMEASPDLSTVRIFRHQASIYPKSILKGESQQSSQ